MEGLEKYFAEAEAAEKAKVSSLSDIVREAAEYNQGIRDLYESIFGGEDK